MATLEDVQHIARSLPATTTGVKESGQGHVDVDGKGFAWTWMERVEPKKPRVPRPDVLALRVSDLQEKEILLASDERKFFTEPHYNGYPAVLLRLPEVGVDELRELLVEAWCARASRKRLKESGFNV